MNDDKKIDKTEFEWENTHADNSNTILIITMIGCFFAIALGIFVIMFL